MDIYKIAPCVCVRDVIEGDKDLLCRFWGSKLVELYNMDCTGKKVGDMYSAFGVDNTLEIYHQTLASDLPIRIIGNHGYVDRSESITLEGVFLRLDGVDKPDQHVIGGFHFGGIMDDDDLNKLLD